MSGQRRFGTCLRTTIPLLYLGTVPPLHGQDCVKKGIERSVYRRLLNEQFANLINPQSPNSIGNFASYESRDGTISFAGSSVLSSGHIVSLKAAGKGGDGLLGLRSDGRLNSSVSVDAQLHLLSRDQSLTYTFASCEAFDRLARKARDEFSRPSVLLDSNAVAKAARRSLLRLRADSAKRAANIQSRSVTPVLTPAERLQLDSLRVELALANDTMRTTALDTMPTTDAQRLASGNQRATDLLQAAKVLEFKGFRISWWSLGAGFANNSFQAFDSTAAFESQLAGKRGAPDRHPRPAGRMRTLPQRHGSRSKGYVV